MTRKELKKDRREFLKKGIMGITGLTLFSQEKKENRNKRVQNGTNKKIIYRTLGRTGLSIPIVGIGVMLTHNIHVIEAALDTGITFIDTAPNYLRGNSEKMLGKIIRKRNRDSFVVATKYFGIRDNRTGLIPDHTNPSDYKESFQRSLESSLNRMQLDFVDIFFIHNVVNPRLLKNQLVKDTLLDLKRQGKTRFLGLSFHHNEIPIIKAAIEEKIFDVILTSYNFRQPHSTKVKKAISEAASAGLGIVAMKVMAGVYWDKERKHPINAKAALKWVLQNRHVHTTVPGISTFDQLKTDISIMEDLSLTFDEKKDLKFGKKMDMTGLYCTQCGKCSILCRHHLNIPTMMRSYMYAYGYKNPGKAKEILKKLKGRDISCHNCNTCIVKCTMGFDVKTKMKDIIRLLDVPDEFLV